MANLLLNFLDIHVLTSRKVSRSRHCGRESLKWSAMWGYHIDPHRLQRCRVLILSKFMKKEANPDDKAMDVASALAKVRDAPRPAPVCPRPFSSCSSLPAVPSLTPTRTHTHVWL